MNLSPEEAAQHLLNRRRARTDIVTYAATIDVPGRPVSDDEDCELFRPVETHLAAHHQLLLRALDETSNTRYGRLLVLMPPGSAKSTYASVVFPSKYLGAAPRRRLILTSYGADLARKMGRKTRSIIRQLRYQRYWNTQLSGDSQAADQFALTNGSEYMASGLLSGITGNRADGAIVDDPLSGRQAAESEKERQTTWDAYQDDLLTRLVPGGWLAMVLTHWHQEDPAGRILPDGWDGESGIFDCKDGMKWRVLCLQAKCETHSDPLGRKIGEFLWPEWFDRQHWVAFERNPMTWNSLFQQRPRPPEGAFFTREMLLVDDQPVETPQLVHVVFAVIDTAIKTGKKNDGTGVVYFSYSKRGGIRPYPLVILDWDYQQIKGASLEVWLPTVFTRLEQLAVETRAMLGSVGAFIEDKGSGTILLQQGENHGWPVTPIDSKLTSMGKAERGFDASSYVSAGDVKITREAYEKVVTFKDTTKNHLVSQVLGFRIDTQENSADDLFDDFCYGVILSVGNAAGF